MNYSYNCDMDQCNNGCQSPMDECCEFNPDCCFECKQTHSCQCKPKCDSENKQAQCFQFKPDCCCERKSDCCCESKPDRCCQRKPVCCCECKQTNCCESKPDCCCERKPVCCCECKPDCCCECKPDCCFECKPNCCCECKVNCCCECKPSCCFEDYFEEEYCKRPKPRPVPIKGRIDVTSKLGCVEGEPLSGVAVELYRVDCTSGFELVSCQYTDSCGCVSFICLEDGLYAIKQPLDPCYFEQPEYYPCYEVCITPCCKRRGVIIINNLKPRDICNRPPIFPKCGLF